MSRSPGSSEMFGMRWNCTPFHDSANEQPCDRLTPVSCSNPRHLLARGLVVLEDAFLDDQPLVGRHAFVVPLDAGERAFLRAIGLDVHEVRTVAELADHLLRRRDEAGAGVVGFLADGAIELGGMADRLVNREPEVRRIENQIVLAGLDASGLDLLGRERGPASGVARHVERLDVLPALRRAARSRARRPGSRRRRRWRSPRTPGRRESSSA